MSALRQRAAQVARTTRTARPAAPRNTRSYGSGHDHHHHHEAHTVEESIATPSVYLTGALLLGSAVVYQVSRPGPNGELSAVHKYFEKLSNYGTEWETKNHLMTAALEQAAHDKHLLYGVERSKFHELTFPEVFTTGSPFNVPAGHYANLDRVVAHYKQQHIDDEARKARKLSAAASQ